MKYQNVNVEAFGYTLPEEVVTTAMIEERLAPLYRRLRLPEGRLELITGVRERRFWEPGVMPGTVSVTSAQKAIEASGIAREHFGALIHGSVCRDYLEPATACSVHHRLGLPTDSVIYDVSNACLGIINGMVQVANMIELGQIAAGVVVGTEVGRNLVEPTIEMLNRNESLTRKTIKDSIASLTIGSASCAVVLCNNELSQKNNRLHAAVAMANTQHCDLCQSAGGDEATSSGMHPLMNTDSEQLMRAGIQTGTETFERFLSESGWSIAGIDRTVCHQVGPTHRKLTLESLKLDPARDYATVEWLGNTGSAALPSAMAIACERAPLPPAARVAMLGIGSGINSVMLAVEWNG